MNAELASPERERDERIAHPAKLLRITQMVRGLVDEARQSPLDGSGRERLRHIYASSLNELKDALSDDLRRELDVFVVPLDRTSTESELRVAQAQLMGWLDGLLHGIQAAAWAQQMEAQAQMQELQRRALPDSTLEFAAEERDGQSAVGQYL
jgi:hypothetical protein